MVKKEVIIIGLMLVAVPFFSGCLDGGEIFEIAFQNIGGSKNL